MKIAIFNKFAQFISGILFITIGFLFLKWKQNKQFSKYNTVFEQDSQNEQLLWYESQNKWLKFLFETLPWFFLVMGLVVTYVLYYSAQKHAYEGLKHDFYYQSQEIIHRIQQRMDAYILMLRSVRGLFNASQYVERHEFKTFVTSLQLQQNYPGVQGVGFSLALLPQEKELHITTIRQNGYPNYQIYPEGTRDFYTSIIYLEPFSDRNLKAFGYDMYTNDVRREAMERSRDSNLAVMSGKVKLVQEIRGRVQAGFLIYVPVYKNATPHDTLEQRRVNLQGWAYSPFRMDDLMSGILNTIDNDYFDLEIYDGKRVLQKSLMYDSNDSLSTGKTHMALYTSSNQIKIADHFWSINIHSLHNFEAKIDNKKQFVILYLGLLSSVFLFSLTWLIISGRKDVFKLARNMTLELTTRQIRDWEIQNAIPHHVIIALTADAYEEDRQRCIDAGMDDFLAKPIVFDTLKLMLNRWLASQSPQSPQSTLISENSENQSSTTTHRPVDTSKIISMMREILPLLAQGEFDAIDRFRALQEELTGTDMAVEIVDAGRLLEECRFDLALENLRKFMVAKGWEEKIV